MDEERGFGGWWDGVVGHGAGCCWGLKMAWGMSGVVIALFSMPELYGMGRGLELETKRRTLSISVMPRESSADVVCWERVSALLEAESK